MGEKSADQRKPESGGASSRAGQASKAGTTHQAKRTVCLGRSESSLNQAAIIDAMGTHTNIAQTIRRLVLNLLRLDKSSIKGGIYNRRIFAASSDSYHASLLGVAGI